MVSLLADLDKLLEKMGKERKDNEACGPEVIERVTESIQEKVDSGWTMPLGWLFKGLIIYFPESGEDDLESNSSQPKQSNRTNRARNTARFAGASVAESADDPSITHIVVGPETPASEISTLRETLSTRKRIPHIVNVEWIEESWKERTLLDEERESSSSWPESMQAD
jgi:DNA ligase-4